MRHFRIYLPLLLATLLSAGCIPSQSQLRMEQDQIEMKRRLAEIERNVLGSSQERNQQMADRLDTLARQLAEHQAALDALRVDLQAVNGRLEDTARSNTQMRDEINLMRDDLSLKIAAIEDRLAQPAAVRAPAAAPGAGAAPAAAANSPEALYQQGLDAILRQNDFARGRELLADFLQRNPGHELAVNAQYWIGEAYYGEKKYENAILQFQDVIQKHGEHPKAAAAMLKQGLAFEALGDRQNARVIMQKVGEAYPLSDEAKKAKSYLDQWK